jgi:Family of unknown function (DUF6282)
MSQTRVDPDLDTEGNGNSRDGTKVKDSAPSRARKARVAAILKGSIDPHVHSGPSIAPRALDHLDLVRQLSEARFAAVVTKDHDYAGVATAALIRKHHPELHTKIFSGVVLNNVVGGINPYAVEHTAAMGGKIGRRLPPRIIYAGKRLQISPIRLPHRRCAPHPRFRCSMQTKWCWIR